MPYKDPIKQKEYQKKYQKKHSRENQLIRRYNITIKQYNRMYEKQLGCCAICSRHQSELGKSLCVDHRHSDGRIRGLLCFNCNTAIGYLKDNPDLCTAAAKYLSNLLL